MRPAVSSSALAGPPRRDVGGLPVLSCFFPASMPRGLLRGAAAVGFVAVLAAGGILLLIPTPLGAHARAVWGVILVTLSIQSVIATGRLRGQRMRVVVSDPLP